MPIMAAQSENDARVAARMLAEAALKHIRQPGPSDTARRALANVFRLVQAMGNPFFAVDARASSDVAFSDAMNGLNPANLRDVKTVLEAAAREVFPETRLEDVSESVRLVFQHAAAPDRVSSPGEALRAQVIRFFEAVANQLEYA